MTTDLFNVVRLRDDVKHEKEEYERARECFGREDTSSDQYLKAVKKYQFAIVSAIRELSSEYINAGDEYIASTDPDNGLPF